MQEIVIQIENLSKMYKLYANNKDKMRDIFRPSWVRRNRKQYYTEFWALRNASLAIHKGERVALIGRNGAGKSTLLKVLCGNIYPTEGRFSVKGKIQALMQLGTGFHMEYTGRQNIKASLLYNNFTAKEIAKLEDEIVDFSELGDFIDQPIKTYSQGMLARLAFSTATAVEPEVLIIDEVLGAGDAYFNTKCVEKMRQITQESGATVVFVSHDLSSVQYLCDRAVLLQRGEITDDGDTLPIIKKYTALVRRDEEERLRIKDFKKAQKEAAIVDRWVDLYQVRYIMLKAKEGVNVKLRKVEIVAGGEVLREVAVGGPMDNSNTTLFYLYDVDATTCWSKSMADRRGSYREILSGEGKTDARLVAMIPVDKDVGALLRVYGDSDEPDALTFSVMNTKGELLVEDEPLPLARLTPINRNSGDGDDGIDVMDYDHAEGHSLKSVTMTNGNGQKRNVYPFDDPPRRLEIVCTAAGEGLTKCTCVLFVNHENGTLMVADVREHKFGKPCKELRLEYGFDQFRLGAGNYNITFALYSGLNPHDRAFQEYLVRLDRTCSFKIEERLDYVLSVPAVYVPVDARAFGDDGESVAQKDLLDIWHGGND
jgi:ABC-type polysaccharide/polyol phosphate transport system ATPase subunit